MLDSKNFAYGFGERDNKSPRSNRMVGFKLLRTGVDAVDADPLAIEQVIDLRDSKRALGNSIILVGRRTDGVGALELQLQAQFKVPVLISAVELLPFAVTVGTGDQDTETAFYRFDDIPAGLYRVVITGVGGSTWDIYSAYSVD